MSNMLRQREGDWDHINRFFWWGGWRPLRVGLVTVVAAFLAPFGADIVLGTLQGGAIVVTLIGGPIWWLAGVRHINENYRDVLREYNDYAEEAGESFLDISDENPRSYLLTKSSGTSPFVRPAKRFYTTTLVVGDTSVAIHEGIGLDMVRIEPYLDDDTRELYYDQISSVSYNRPYLKISTSDGGTLEFRSSRSPDDALNDLQNRLREYKSLQPNSS